MLTYTYMEFWEAIDGGILSGPEADTLKSAAEDGTVVTLLADWAQNHSDTDFRQVCANTLALMEDNQ